MSDTIVPTAAELPTLCGCCSRPLHSGDGTDRGFESLLAMCDVLVLRALEILGKRLSRRSHMPALKNSNCPWHEAHTMLPEPTSDKLHASLAGAWEMVPTVLKEHGCCGVTASLLEGILDSYVRDLVAARLPHKTDLLRISLTRHLFSDSGMIVR